MCLWISSCLESVLFFKKKLFWFLKVLHHETEENRKDFKSISCVLSQVSPHSSSFRLVLLIAFPITSFIVGFIDLFLSFELILVLIRLINEDTLAQCVAGAIDSEISTSYNPLKFQDEARQLCFSFGFYSNYTLLNKFLNNDLNFKQLNQAFNNKIAIRDERNVISQVIMCILFVSILKVGV